MAVFIELTESSGNKVLINSENVLKVCPNENGCIIYFNVAAGNSSTVVHVVESYAFVKKKLQ